jgi:hypothetical protein
MKNVLTGLLFSFIFIGLFTHTHAQVYTSYIPIDQRKCAQMYPNNCAQQSYYYTQGCYTYYYNGVTNTTTLTGNSCQVNQNQYSNQYIYSYPSTYTYTQPSYQTFL